MPRRWRRSITLAFKAQVFLELLSGRHSSPELCREHRLSHSLFTTSKGTALSGLPSLVRGEERGSSEQAATAELEQLGGRQAGEL
jgi:hypothetical protein